MEIWGRTTQPTTVTDRRDMSAEYQTQDFEVTKDKA